MPWFSRRTSPTYSSAPVSGIARIGLDILHIDGVGADLLGHHDAVALSGHRVGGEDLVVHLGLYLRISTLEPKPPVASTTALHFTSDVSPRHGILHFHARYGARIVGDQLDGLAVVVDEHDVVHAVDAVGQLRGHLRPEW